MPDLSEERDFLLRSLDDLEAERAQGEIDEEAFRALHDDYTARAAEVIRRLDGSAEPAVGPDPVPRPRRLRWVVAGAVVVFAAVAGILLARASGERGAGETATGEIRQSSAGLLLEASDLEQQGDVVEALRRYDEILDRNPDNVEALARRGSLLVRVGDERLLVDAVGYLDRALALDPDQPIALLFRGLAHRIQGEPEEALALYRQLDALDRELPLPREVLEQQITELESELGR